MVAITLLNAAIGAVFVVVVVVVFEALIEIVIVDYHCHNRCQKVTYFNLSKQKKWF